nr:MAG TPA: hypothetical protein [Bacteriophage sp.]
MPSFDNLICKYPSLSFTDFLIFPTSLRPAQSILSRLLIIPESET